MKLRTKIPTLLIPLIVIPLLVLGWIAYKELEDASKQRVFGEMRASMERLVVQMNTELETSLANIELFSKHTLVKKYLLTRDEKQRYTLMLPPLLRLFKSFQEAFPSYYEIRVLLTDGYEDMRLTWPHIDNKTDDEADSPFFQELAEARDQNYAAILRNPDNQEISLFVGKPMILRDLTVDDLNASPKLRGYLALTIKLQDLAHQIEQITIGEAGYLFATDADGNVLFHPDRISLSEPVTQGLLDGKDKAGFESQPARLSFNGRMVFLSKRQLHSDLYLFAVIPEDELLAISRRLAAIVAAITLFTILVTMACLFTALVYLVIKPIHQLRNLSKEIGRGQWDIRSDVNSKDEIGELADAFEDMAGNLKRSDEQVRYLAYHDSLTGLPNRAMFKEHLGHAIASARKNREKLALLFLDIDDFKRVNDTLGHQAGDILLQEVARRLSKCLRESDFVAVADNTDESTGTLARQGGDEFIVLLSDIKHAFEPSAVANRIIESLSNPFTIQRHEYHTSASIGITVYPTDGEQADDLIKNADIAMYHAKERGKNCYEYFRESLNVAALERLVLESKLRTALENNELTLHYQPQFDALSGEPLGLEALLRWHDPETGLITPNVFIPVAEQSGLVLPIGNWVLHEACRQARAWQKAGYRPVLISVNVSSIQFAKSDLSTTIELALKNSGLDPRYLVIEITESTIMANPSGAVETLANLKALGVGVALDDFGTGYSSLNYLRRFPIDTLKIDHSFIIDIDKNSEDEEIVSAIVAMAHALKLRVVAEGVETREQLRVVVDKECDAIQGFLFSRPLPADQVVHQLQKKNLKIA